ncbi:MAG: hypothetical protein ACNA8W_03115 [Bradymonadaceae bacterium]
MKGLRLHLQMMAFLIVWFCSGPGSETVFEPGSTWIASAEATTYRVRTLTVGRGTQYFRTDQSVAAPRRLTQGLSLSAFDLVGDETGSFNAHLGVRYFSDFGLEERLRREPLFDHQWNDLTLDIAYLQWRPVPAFELRLGRQWSMNAAGMRDFDGLLLRVGSSGGDGLHPYAEVYGGRDVQLGLTRWDPSTWDVQGLPPNEDGLADAPWHWSVGGQAGLRWSRYLWGELAYGRRFRRPSGPLDAGPLDAELGQAMIIGDERFAQALSGTPHPNLTVTARTSYHTLLGAFDRATLMTSWRLPWLEPENASVLSAGVEERRPIFDSASIFNLFGARPHRGAFLTYQHPVEAISTVLEARTWSRFYFDGDDGPFLGDARAIGGALAHHSRVRLGDRPVQWTSQFSHQTGGSEGGGQQFLSESRVRMPVIWDDVFVSARGLFLLSRPAQFRHDSAHALAGVLGADVPVGEGGRLSLAVETSGSSIYPINTSVFASFELEIYP